MKDAQLDINDKTKLQEWLYRNINYYNICLCNFTQYSEMKKKCKVVYF